MFGLRLLSDKALIELTMAKAAKMADTLAVATASRPLCLPPQIIETFHVIEKIATDFDLSDVTLRYCAEHGLPRHVGDLHARELLRYFVISTLFEDVSFPMAGPSDHFWHIFLLFTRKYNRFCEDVAGKFLHHEPICADSESSSSAEQDLERYNLLLDIYEYLYGIVPPTEVWPRMHRDIYSLSPNFIVS